MVFPVKNTPSGGSMPDAQPPNIHKQYYINSTCYIQVLFNNWKKRTWIWREVERGILEGLERVKGRDKYYYYYIIISKIQKGINARWFQSYS